MKKIEMTTGSLWKNILLFSLPLMLTQLLEVLFNLSDVAVVGKFASYQALGSVGSTSTLVTLFAGFLIGMGAGVNVAVARALGIGSEEETEKTIHSAFIICTSFGVVVCLACNLFARQMLEMLNTKEELMDGAVLYLKIFSLGMPAMAIYNCGNGVMSAAGDTRRPLLYLTIAGALNVALNLFFVIGLHMAADGVALASAIAQCVSAALIVAHLLRRKDSCRLDLRKLRIHKMASKRILMMGVPSGLQNAIFAIANLFVQVGVNSLRRDHGVRQRGGRQRRHAGVQYDGSVLHRLRQLRQPELGRGKQGPHPQELLYQYALRLPHRCAVRRRYAAVRPAVPGSVRQ